MDKALLQPLCEAQTGEYPFRGVCSRVFSRICPRVCPRVCSRVCSLPMAESEYIEI